VGELNNSSYIRCSNADPNYGMMWFHCRHMPSDTPRLLIRHAKLILAQDLSLLYPLYLAAIIRRLRVEEELEIDDAVAKSAPPADCGDATTRSPQQREKEISCRLREAPSVDGDCCGDDYKVEPWDFVTGLVGLNRIASRISELGEEEKRKLLFGSDQLVP